MDILSDSQLGGSLIQQTVLWKLLDVYDPEMGVNIVDMGLVYRIHVEPAAQQLFIDMTLTSKACPMGKMIVLQVEETLKAGFPDMEIIVTLVWDPKWSIDRMSDAGKQQLGWEL